jgi:hypothetical protein
MTGTPLGLAAVLPVSVMCRVLLMYFLSAVQVQLMNEAIAIP